MTYGDLNTLGHVFQTDVLILGGGMAGLWAALKASKYTDKVMIVDKGPFKRGGQGSMCGGDMVVWDPEDDIKNWVKELSYYFEGLAEQDVIECLMKRSLQCMQEYERMGHKFARDENGKLKRVYQRGLKHIGSVLSRPFGTGGKSLIQHLVAELEKTDVRLLPGIQITDILMKDGHFAGLAGFHTRSAEFYIIKAKSLIISTGNSSWKASYGTNTCTGETFSMALRAGVQLRNFEFLKVWNVPAKFCWEGQTMLLPLGARFVNAEGEDFMSRYSPTLGAKMDPHFNTRAMVEEYRAGRAPLFFDVSKMPEENIRLLTPTVGWMKLNYERLCTMGQDLFRDKVEWMPQVDYAIGGIDTDINGQTCIPGIFAAGRARNLESGLYLGGWAVSGTATTGSIAGEQAGQYAASLDYQYEPDYREVKELKHNILEPLGKDGIPYKEVLNEFRRIIAPYDVTILKTETGLRRALKRFEEIRADLLPHIAAPTPHFLTKRVEMYGIADTTELYLNASLLRRESRGSHYREDFPDKDPASLGWYLASRQDGRLVWNFRPVPMERYEFHFDSYYSENFIPLSRQA
ncbi:FAD-dependent oxidoreductase [Mailhella massiliensis]|uniref:FAD-binding protein n=1 Tax=Mailhella massiliensis TaxID=1903261 RepID=A0A921AW31_9BACT|nr:FAD-dependent oxidoreductase [Mailhella massiliensis]HJD96877.1 FAD-binding protein [Mailhella massiliensis]